MSENEVNMITRAIENLEKKVDELIGSFAHFCAESADKFARMDGRIQTLEKNSSEKLELGKWKKEWNLKKWLAVISFISLSGVVITIINIISGWIK
jgi:hypothetical protein